MTIINEGSNDKKFWEVIGQNREYVTSPQLKKQSNSKARLFKCSLLTGSFTANPLFDFDQSDLENYPSDAFILDLVFELYVWFSPKVNEDLKRKTMEIATVRFFIHLLLFIKINFK